MIQYFSIKSYFVGIWYLKELPQNLILLSHGVQRRMISVDNFFVFLRFLFFCFVVAICDLVHAVKATYGLP